jgi:hypothetical protein
MIECPECRRLFEPERPSRADGYCSRHCARCAQARRGVPSAEDKKASLLDAVAKRFDELFKDK